MSERLSSVEIEDVLSSIRRLVSEDLRPGPKTETAAPAEAPVAAEAPVGDKLILTPALRIDPETEAAADAPEVTPSFHSVRQGRGASVVDRVTRAMPDEDWEPVTEAAAAPRSDWASEAEAAVEAAGEAWSETPVAPVEQAAEPQEEAEEMAEDAPAVAETEGWPPSDVAEANWSAPGEQAPMEAEQPEDPGWSEVEPMAIDRPTGTQDDVHADGEAEDAPDAGADLPDWARMEADAEAVAEAEVALTSGPAERADPSGASVQEDAVWADAAEAEIRRELEDDATATVFARFDDDNHDDRHFDEEMLRDLVRDIIREELQGALGERITRNVRKLVRAEIARALAVRDFE